MDMPAFYSAIRPIFGGELTQPQVDGIEAILDAWTKSGETNPRYLAYILATAKYETADTMQPVRETLANTDAKAKERLTKAWKAGKLPWVKSDYWSSGYFGRGFVQLTHKANYEKAGKKLGLDLVSDPSKAMIPEVAALILVRGCLEGWFTGKKLSDYPNDFVGSRRVVNGTDRAVAIAGLAYRFLDAIEQASVAPVKPAPVPPVPAQPKDRGPAVVIALFIGAVIAGIGMFATATWGFIVNLLKWIF